MEDNDELFNLDDYDNKELTEETPSITTNTENPKNIINEPIKENSISTETKETTQQKNIEEENEIADDDEDSNEESKNSSEEENQENDLLKQTNEEIIGFEERHQKLKEYAEEDTIDISKYDEIKNYAITFPFQLDEFQKRSIIRLEEHQNVLVCAHTSSGKTVVAEYGIALGKKQNKRVLYTSPIKALSNQKFREFKKKFNDVGILTGDVSINPDAQCLIMTTEILQSSLYKNSELLNQVEWVIFDEVHYINDKERGHVWEEILILLPRGIGIIMLSATVPNYMEFAQWVGNIKKTKVYVQNTLKRVVPLEHNLYIDFNNVFKVKTKDGKILEGAIDKAFNALRNKKNINFKSKKEIKEEQENEKYYKENIKYFDQYKPQENAKFSNKNKQNKNNRNKKNNKKNYYEEEDSNNVRITKMHHKIAEIVDYLFDKKLCPAVIFVFSIKKITEYSRMLSLTCLFTKEELDKQQKIKNFYNSVVASMSPEDREIPQVKELAEILPTGIGIHHSGLLPILKETVEVLYSRGLLKVLFATTSFSIGLNMPTRTVVFTDIYKFNDESKVILNSSEYLQMCGRAGRRGIDDIGNVFILLMTPNKNEEEEILEMLKGEGTDVESNFRLCYKTLLSFFSRNMKSMNEFFSESFLESHEVQCLPKKLAEIEMLKARKEKLKKIDCKYDKKNNKNNEKNEENNNENKIINDNNLIDIEDISKYPIYDYVESYKKYKNLCNNIYSDNNIYKHLNNRRGLGLMVQEDEGKRRYNKSRKLNFGKIVVLIEAYENEYWGSIWCLGIKKLSKKSLSQTKNLKCHEGNIGNISYFYREYHAEDIIQVFNQQVIKLQKKKYEKDKSNYYFLKEKDLSNTLNNLYKFQQNYRRNRKNYPEINLEKMASDTEISQYTSDRYTIIENTKKNLCFKCPLFIKHKEQLSSYNIISQKVEELEKELKPENLKHYQEFKTRLNILKELKYVNDDFSLTLKGKAAREIGTTDCVLVTEVLTSDILRSLSDEYVVGFISGFASNKNEIDTNDPAVSKEFSTSVEKFFEIYENVKNKEAEFDFVEDKYNRRMTFEYSQAMINWMKGKDFLEILHDTQLEEGKLYNLIMRIFLLLEEINNFYGMLGNMEESKRYQDIKTKLMRGVMSLQSLYLQEKIDIDCIS